MEISNVNLCRNKTDNNTFKMLPAGFEPATFHLGGERSIQLSYGSITCDFRFWVLDCPVSPGI